MPALAMLVLAFLEGLSVPLRADSDLDQHLLLRAVSAGLQEPTVTEPVYGPLGRQPEAYLGQAPVYAHRWDDADQASLRWYGGWDPVADLRLEWNLLGTWAQSSSGFAPALQPLGRSAVLEREPYDAADWQLQGVVDQLNLRWQTPSLSLVAGRQPVNLGQNFYFSPLDLFQPFQPQQTYRDFRPGVDALRATVSTGHFTQFDALAVAGYKPVQEGSNATQAPLWLDGPQGQESALLRAQSGGDAWAFSALGGRFDGQGVGGASVQLEGLGSSWILEGLCSQALDPFPTMLSSTVQVTLGCARQWNADWNTRVEISELASRNSSDVLKYAAGATWQASPLWTVSPAVLSLGDEGQFVGMVDAGWSSSENGSLHLIVELPILFEASHGNAPPGAQPPPSQTETYPTALSIDYRLEL